jgi:hypothetical protein
MTQPQDKDTLIETLLKTATDLTKVNHPMVCLVTQEDDLHVIGSGNTVELAAMVSALIDKLPERVMALLAAEALERITPPAENTPIN